MRRAVERLRGVFGCMREDKEQRELEPTDEEDLEAPSMLCCSITSSLMRDPVILVQTKQTFERSAIEHWLRSSSRPLRCPATNVKLRSTRLNPDASTKRAVQSFLRDRRLRAGLDPLNPPGSVSGPSAGFDFSSSSSNSHSRPSSRFLTHYHRQSSPRHQISPASHATNHNFHHDTVAPTLICGFSSHIERELRSGDSFTCVRALRTILRALDARFGTSHSTNISLAEADEQLGQLTADCAPVLVSLLDHHPNVDQDVSLHSACVVRKLCEHSEGFAHLLCAEGVSDRLQRLAAAEPRDLARYSLLALIAVQRATSALVFDHELLLLVLQALSSPWLWQEACELLSVSDPDPQLIAQYGVDLMEALLLVEAHQRDDVNDGEAAGPSTSSGRRLSSEALVLRACTPVASETVTGAPLVLACGGAHRAAAALQAGEEEDMRAALELLQAMAGSGEYVREEIAKMGLEARLEEVAEREGESGARVVAMMVREGV